ncbi:MAG: mitochondrial fission ELM1 family protein [Planctomycetaceae bacterium]
MAVLGDVAGDRSTWRSVFADDHFLEVEPPPRLVVSCGRQGAVTAIALKRKLGDKLFSVHVQDPKISIKSFDLIIAPAHDGLTGANVVHSIGAVHHITPQKLEAARLQGPTAEMRKLTQPFAGVILGGPNRYYGYGPADIDPLIDRLHTLTKRQPFQLAVIPSRRTPPAVLDRFVGEFGDRHFVWQGQGENPYLAVLASASHLIVAGDSVSMISEAAATEKPVHVHYFRERRRARRFRQFHESFARAGITRPFEGRCEQWTYRSPDRTGLIAALIREHLR